MGARTGVVVIDLDSWMSGRSDYFIDAVHMTEAGSATAAAIITEELEPLIRGGRW